MLNKLKYFFLFIACISIQQVFAQISTYPQQQQQQQQRNPFGRDTLRSASRVVSDDELIDSLRKKEENKGDSVIFNSKFIRITNELLLKDSTQVFPLDTGLTDFENYSPLYQVKRPKIGLGSLGLAERDLLFEPDKRIGFDVGLHYLDAYLINPLDVQYYRARVPYTNLYLVTGGRKEQIFKASHTQNVNPQLNIGFNLNLIGSQGFYNRQNGSALNAAVFSWYESKSKRYNLLTNATFNNLKAPESGGILKDTIFKSSQSSFDPLQEKVRLPLAKDQWHNDALYVKQFYYLGRIDTVGEGKGAILPTQRVAHTFYYNARRYQFVQSGVDTYKVFPDTYYNTVASNDSLRIIDIHNDFTYSFYLRPKSGSFLKNEVKLDLGIAHDYYQYTQSVSDSVLTTLGRLNKQDVRVRSTFQNITLKARLGYHFSDRIALDGDLQQIAQGYNGGDFLYDFKLTLAGGRKAGRVIFGAYTQNNTPPLVYTNWVSNHYRYNYNFANVKTNSASFNYINDALRLNLKAEYFLISNYLYFKADQGGNNALPAQVGSDINLLKISLSKTFTWRRWTFDAYGVYQKTDFQSTLRTPEVYVYGSVYYKKLLFEVLNLTAGLNVRYNSTYVAPSYAVGLGQFYNGPDITYSSYPVAAVFVKATLQRTNLFLMYDYANQNMFSRGYFTVVRYPMQSALLKFGVSWSFYN